MDAMNFDKLYDSVWSEWKKFPDPSNGEYLYAPFGCGVYQLYDIQEKMYVLFGYSLHVAHRISSLLPTPEGIGNRSNNKKRDYVKEHIKNIQYRTMPFDEDSVARQFEKYIKNKEKYIFDEKSKK